MDDKTKFIEKIYDKKQLKEIETKLKCLGNDTKYNAVSFCLSRLIITATSFILTILLTDMGYIYAPFVAIACYYLFYYLNITKKTKIRNIKVTCDNVNSEISKEFKAALDEMNYGKSLIEALSDLKNRISSDIINNIILNIIQTNRFGNSILDTLYNEVDFLRDKEILTIKEQINKIPNKVSIISVLFIVPLILILILGPYLIEFIS